MPAEGFGLAVSLVACAPWEAFSVLRPASDPARFRQPQAAAGGETPPPDPELQDTALGCPTRSLQSWYQIHEADSNTNMEQNRSRETQPLA